LIASPRYLWADPVDTEKAGNAVARWLNGPEYDRWRPQCDISSPSDNFINQADFAHFAEHWGQTAE